MQKRIGALFVSSDPLFFIHRDMLVALAARHAVPAIYADREQAEAGGLISYGASRSDAYRQAGAYVGRILKGESAGSLPVVLPTKYELVINIKSAKELGLSVPNSMQLLDAATSRRIDRIAMMFAAVHESVPGTKRTWRDVRLESAFGGKGEV